MQSTQDPMSRFLELNDSIWKELGVISNLHAYKFTALASLNCDGETSEIPGKILAIFNALSKNSETFSHLNTSFKYVVSALLLLNDDTPEAFGTEIDRVSHLFRDWHLRRGDAYETIAILLLRVENGMDPIDSKTIERFKNVYEEMKKYHWWLTGPEDFPACALLTCRDEPVSAMGEGIEKIYHELSLRGFEKGDPLQTAAHLLYLIETEPSVTTNRFVNLGNVLKQRGVEIKEGDYEELAHLSVLDLPTEKIADCIMKNREGVKNAGYGHETEVSFSLCSGITFVELLNSSENPQSILNTRSLDLKAITTAQIALRAGCISLME